MKAALVAIERIERQILLIRGQKVLLDSQLAELYGVATGNLIRAMKRNGERFPEDFMFQLSVEEFADLRCHLGISSRRGGRRYSPYAFTEHGVVSRPWPCTVFKASAGILNRKNSMVSPEYPESPLPPSRLFPIIIPREAP